MNKSLLANIKFKEIFNYPIKNKKYFLIFFIISFIASFIAFKLFKINIYLVLPFFLLFPIIDYFFFRISYKKKPLFEKYSIITYLIAGLKIGLIIITLLLTILIIFLFISITTIYFMSKGGYSYTEFSNLLDSIYFIITSNIIEIILWMILNPLLYRLGLLLVDASITNPKSIKEILKQTKNYYWGFLIISSFINIPIITISLDFLNDKTLLISLILSIIRIFNLLLQINVYNFFFKLAK